MAQIRKIRSEFEVNCSADKLYSMYAHNSTQLPKHVPRFFKDIQVLQGDGKSVGTVKSWKCELGKGIFTAKEKIVAMDNKTRSITYNILEGELMKAYKTLQGKFVFTAKGERICSVNIYVEFEKANENSPTPTAYLEFYEAATRELAPQL